MFSIDNPLNQKAMLIINFEGTYLPYMYSSPQNELLGCRTGAWLGSMLNPALRYMSCLDLMLLN